MSLVARRWLLVSTCHEDRATSSEQRVANEEQRATSSEQRVDESMAKALVVVESPAKAKTINKYLGRDYKVIASMGHIRDLPKSKLGVDVDNDFAEEYVS